MAKILFVHGIGQQRKSPAILHDELIAGLNEGLSGIRYPIPAQDFLCVFYGDLFLPAGSKAAGDPFYDVRDVSEVEAALLALWWQEAARTDPAVVSPCEAVKVRIPRTIQRALDALGRCAFFAGIAERVMIGDLKQVTSYLGVLRHNIRERVKGSITPDVRVVIGHSLGSVVAYETLAEQKWPGVRALVTLGSPLGIRNLVFDKLEPPPVNGRGAWPGSVENWVNVVDMGDVVAIEKKLSRLFGPQVQDRVVNNGSHAHDASMYLGTGATGEAVTLGLQER
jgi:hypothetical protein